MSERDEADEMGEMSGDSKTRRAAGTALIVAGALIMSTATSLAVAQGPNPDSRPGPTVAGKAGSGAGARSDEPAGLHSDLGEFPFTGLDLMILGGLALVLLGTGMAQRRLSASRVPGSF